MNFDIYLDSCDDAHTHINMSSGHMTILRQRKFTQVGRAVSYFAFTAI